MSEVVTKRLLTDETGQLLVTALNSIAASCKPDATEINMGPNDRTKVATQINSLSEQIGERKIKTYTALSQIELTTGATIAQVYNALSDGSEIIEQAGNLANNGYCPYTDSMIRVTRFNANRGSIEAYSKASNAQCFLAVDNRSAPDGKWQQLAITPVVAYTATAFSINTNSNGVAAVPSASIPTVSGRTRVMLVIGNFTSSDLSASQIPPTVVETSSGNVFILGSPSKTYTGLQLKGLFI